MGLHSAFHVLTVLWFNVLMTLLLKKIRNRKRNLQWDRNVLECLSQKYTAVHISPSSKQFSVMTTFDYIPKQYIEYSFQSYLYHAHVNVSISISQFSSLHLKRFSFLKSVNAISISLSFEFKMARKKILTLK